MGSTTRPRCDLQRRAGPISRAIQLGRLEVARGLLGLAVFRCGRLRRLSVLEILIAARSGRHPRAATLLRRHLARHPNDMEARLILGTNYRRSAAGRGAALAVVRLRRVLFICLGLAGVVGLVCAVPAWSRLLARRRKRRAGEGEGGSEAGVEAGVEAGGEAGDEE